jgi:anti-sigma B factor antagonist
MQFHSEEVDGVLVVETPSLDLDASNADEFKRQAIEIVDGFSKVVMNMGSIGFMDSAGLGAVLAVYKKVRAEDGQFRVFGLNAEVKALFELVRMQRLFGVSEDRDSAVLAVSTNKNSTATT